MPHLFIQKLCLRNSKRHHASITTKTSFTNSTTEVADVQNGPENDWAKYRELFESQIPNFLNTWFNETMKMVAKEALKVCDLQQSIMT